MNAYSVRSGTAPADDLEEDSEQLERIRSPDNEVVVDVKAESKSNEPSFPSRRSCER